MFVNKLEDMREKVGIGIVTCNRPDYLKGLLDSIKYCNWAEIVIINDGEMFECEGYNYYIQHNETNLGVGKSKNKAMQHLLDKGCDYIFIIEDDVIILDDAVFDKYIQASKVSGIQHFNYGPGSPFNRRQEIQNFDLHNRDKLSNISTPYPKLTIDYKNLQIDLYEHCAGVFSFFTKEILYKVGLNNEDFFNAWEHVEHTYRIILANGHPPFWWFADIKDSVICIKVQEDAIKKSSTSQDTKKWFANIIKGRELYKSIHGMYPNLTPHTSKTDVVTALNQIKSIWTI
jgi:GT2 family glycosyltransferase